ncbi:MAG: hypothetical protein RLZZ369_650 [Pseudomonadota bacterium]|jgi:Rrf2 family nitric oxide-sensitive transcriptional repressor|uniref:Rrf2 family transcriptional regulator n=1 Tax=Aquabacterium sp. TaxID=1872578 RepID=UPI001B6C1706|nr:Rrf2 family transcriptional regulator [Aquabacterium sp.]MBP7133495.1 Rrf2 family transcriptional regulator [Aquabacterium sp.]
MQLTRFTDLGLRVLMYLSSSTPGTPTTIAEITDRFDVSHHHLTKVVQFMGQQGWLITARGKGGGISLAMDLRGYRLGDTIRALERNDELIDCAEPPCALRGQCSLKGLLHNAQEVFYQALNQHTLADAVASPTREAIIQLHRIPLHQTGECVVV